MNRYRNSAAAVFAVLLAASCSPDRGDDTVDPPHDQNQTPSTVPPAGGGAKLLAKSIQQTQPADEDAAEDAAGEADDEDADPAPDAETPGEGDPDADAESAEPETPAAPPAPERIPEPMAGGAFTPQAGVDSYTAMLAQLEAMNRASQPELRAMAARDLEAWESREEEADAEARALEDEADED